ncbi:hypothetical protein BDZ97DRAFT_1814611 [Flammula alnicola]|nr:hypothetical protein BDZ97DRAFT_1814611 [Flammula alnicola]
MLQSLSSSPNFSHFPSHHFPRDIKTKPLLDRDHEPAEIVDIALQALQRAGVELIEWRAVLYRRMNVPILVKNFSYVVPDDDLEGASDILSSLGLPLTPPSTFLLRYEGDFRSTGRFHRVTPETEPFMVQHLVLYPLSFSSLAQSELTEETPFHLTSSYRCSKILVPRPSAVYASLIRMMLNYPRQCSTRTHLESDLSELIGYNLLDLSGGYVDPDDNQLWEDLQVNSRIERAVSLIQQWSCDREWREGEEWIADALIAVVRGSVDIGDLPYNAS